MTEPILFRKTKELEAKTGTFLMNIIQSGVLFAKALACYFEQGVGDDFTALRKQVSALEAENDSLRREVEHQLYILMLLPDMRSDILRLIEGCDKIINKYETDLILLSIERPAIPTELREPLKQMTQGCITCVDTMITGLKIVLKGGTAAEFIDRIYVLEHQVDKQAMALKAMVFQELKLPLARQLQLKEFIYGIEKISDMAEDMADVLSVFVAKHAI